MKILSPKYGEISYLFLLVAAYPGIIAFFIGTMTGGCVGCQDMTETLGPTTAEVIFHQ